MGPASIAQASASNAPTRYWSHYTTAVSHGIAGILDGRADASILLARLCRLARQYSGAIGALACVIEPTTNDLCIEAVDWAPSSMPGTEPPLLHVRFALGSAPMPDCPAAGAPTRLEPDLVSPAIRELLPDPGTGVFCVPIGGQPAPWGVLVLCGDCAPLPEGYLALVRDLPSPTPATGRTDAVGGLEQLTDVMAALSAVGPHSPVDDLQDTLVRACQAPLGTDLVALFLFDSFVGDLDCVATNGVTDEVQAAFADLFGSRLTDRSQGGTWEVSHLGCLPQANGEQLAAFTSQGIEAAAVSAVRSESGANGALVAFYRRPDHLTHAHLALLQAIAAEAGLAMSYALAIEQSTQLLEGLAGENRELTQQATRDGLTGLANHRWLQQTLADMCKTRPGRTPRTFSLIMVDVDHFKIYNDTYGHRQGDAALRQVAEIVSAGLRQDDMAARYGGEEFAVVLRGVGRSEAAVIADRLRRNVADRPCTRGTVTVSMGVAEFPSDGSTAGEVIERADKALYHAKITGRNRVVVWGTAACGAPTGANGGAQDSSPATKTILIVEPPQWQPGPSLKELLAAECYRIRPCSGAAEAAEILKASAFDLALVTNDSLPKRDWTVLTDMAAIHPDMPIVIVTSHNTLEESREALRRGASDILLTPCNPAELPIVIERNLERRRMERLRLEQRSNGIMLQAIEALVAAIDAKDPYTAGHSKRVTELSLAISDGLELSNEERYALELAARLHDIGKLGLPDSALNKQTQLTETEWLAMREHPALGSRIVGAIDDLSYVSTIIRHHHERLDGSGYPDGLAGPAIPYLAQIIAVADAYEAMTSERAHRAPLSPKEALEELRNGGRTHYNLKVVETLSKCLIDSGAILALPTATEEAA